MHKTIRIDDVIVKLYFVKNFIIYKVKIRINSQSSQTIYIIEALYRYY